jgi:hypothetical protein
MTKRTSQRGELAEEVARLKAALEHIARLAEGVDHADEMSAWSAIGGIKYLAATALAVQP